MTDEQSAPSPSTISQPLQKKEDKKPTSGGGHRSKKSNASRSNAGPGNSNASGAVPGGPRPSSRGSNKKAGGSTSAETSDSNKKKDSEAKKPNDGRKLEQRNNNSNTNSASRNSNQGRGNGGGGGNSNHKKGQSQSASRQNGSSNNGGSKDAKPPSTTPVPVPGSESTDALTSLQRVITDLKSISPPSQPSVVSNLPPTAPVFQPGTSGLPAVAAAAAKHRKAASLGSQVNNAPVFPPLSQRFSPMASMQEDNEGQQSFEEGEISEEAFIQSSFPRPGSLTAPRFAAFGAGQGQQGEVLGASGRPQLAPTFRFGARRRAASNVPPAPPINEEEDAGFQFPQQNQQPDFTLEQPVPPNNETRSQIPNIMREQVSC